VSVAIPWHTADNRMQNRQYFVYIITNQRNTVLYTGVTNDLNKRIFDHKNKTIKGFTQKYNIDKLVYYEVFDNINYAIQREKQIKSGSRINKLKLIKNINPNFNELT
jgi:putative endonuclease